MPVLPLIDLMILIAWTSLMVAGILKAVAMAMATRASLLGMSPFDWVLMAGVALLFAVALAARVWVKAHEPELLRLRGEPEVLPNPAPLPPAEAHARLDAAPPEPALQKRDRATAQ